VVVVKTPEVKAGKGEPKWTLGGIEFWRKKDIDEFTKYLKGVYPVGRPRRGQDKLVMIDLFTAYDENRGEYDPDNPIVKVCVRRNLDGPGIGFRVYYADGTAKNPSVPNAITSLGGRDISWRRYASAARATIQWQIDDFRMEERERGVDEHFAMTAHVDHLPPNEFHDILIGFLEEWEVSHREIEFETSDYNRDVNWFCQPWRGRFEVYHAGRADLQLLTKKEHEEVTAERRRQRNQREEAS
jgi:hypothetical protein